MEQTKDSELVKDLLVDSYAHGELPEEDYLKFMETIEKASPQAARAMLVLLEKSPAYERAMQGRPATEVQTLRLVSSPLVRKGEWINSNRIRLELDRSSAVLDMRCLTAYHGETIEIDFALDSTSCVVKLPRGAFLQDEIQRTASNVHVTSRGENDYKLTIRLVGYADKSQLRIKTCGR
jgi:hypothetical protein